MDEYFIGKKKDKENLINNIACNVFIMGNCTLYVLYLLLNIEFATNIISMVIINLFMILQFDKLITTVDNCKDGYTIVIVDTLIRLCVQLTILFIAFLIFNKVCYLISYKFDILTSCLLYLTLAIYVYNSISSAYLKLVIARR